MSGGQLVHSDKSCTSVALVKVEFLVLLFLKIDVLSCGLVR